jgi:hypothetical protein
MTKKREKKKTKKVEKINKYSIKTRNINRNTGGMKRELKNLEDSQLFRDINIKKKILRAKNSKGGNIKKISKKIKKIKIKKGNDKKNESISAKDISKGYITQEHKINTVTIKRKNRNKVNNRNDWHKKISNIIYKYILNDVEYFELKEVLSYINVVLGINLNYSGIRIKDKDSFLKKMNNILNNRFKIYYNKIFVTEDNLLYFFNYLSGFIKMNPNEIIEHIKKKCKIQIIEEYIHLDEYFKPRLVLIEK